VGSIHGSLYEGLSGTNALMQSFHGILHRVGIETRVDRWANEAFRPTIPDPETAWVLKRIGLLNETRYREYVAQDGWPDDLISVLEHTWYRPAGVPLLLELLRRGLITLDDFVYRMKQLRMEDKDANALAALKITFPGAPDLARLRVKQVVGDEDYKAAAATYGLEPTWADRLTEGAYTPPPFDQSLELFWRGKISDAEMLSIWRLIGYKETLLPALRDLANLIPPPPDIIRMVVREAFLPEMVVSAPDVFAEYMAKKGFSREWSDRYWTAHFEPIALRQAYENLWRGFWDKDDFMFALHIADVHPRWREDIYNVAFGPPGMRELGYGYDTGLYTLEDIVKYRRWGGLSPEDADKAGRAMVAYRTEAEREALRREAIADYIAGLDDETELRNKLAAIGGRPEIIELWVSRAMYREDRDVKVQLVSMVKDQFVKGLITEAELRSDLSAIGVVPARIDVHVAQAVTRKGKQAREETVEKKRLLTESKVAQAWELGLIGDSQYVSRVVDLGYTTEDAQLLLDIQRTPRPVTPEEMDRRRRSVQSRINRTRRRYELQISRLDVRTSVTAGEIEALETEMKETLDVIDFQILSIGEDLAAITPEVLTKPIIAARARVLRRYEVAFARVDRRESALTEEITSTEKIFAETVDVVDVEVAFLIQDLPQDALEAAYKDGFIRPEIFVAELIRRGWSRVDAEAAARTLRR